MTVELRSKDSERQLVEGEFLFTAATARKSLLGAAKGKIRFHGDLTKPTLPNENWRPSL